MVYVKRCNRCLPLLIIAAVFSAAAVALIIPGSLGVSPGGNRYNDILLYLGLVSALFGVIFIASWCIGQIEVDESEDEIYHNQLILRKNKQFYSTSSRLKADVDSNIELLPHEEKD